MNTIGMAFGGKVISVPPLSINNDGIRKISQSFIGELQQYPFLEPPHPTLRLIKKYRHDQPFTSPF